MIRFAKVTLFFAAAFFLASAVSPCAADDKAPAAPDKQSLDDELLENLGDDLLDGLDDLPALKPKGGKPARGDGAEPSELDEQLGRELGEDAELGPEEDPLSSIGQRMRTVEELIAEKKTSGQTKNLQRQIVEDLDKLIKEARRRQQQQSGASSKSSPGSQRSKVRQPGRQPATDGAQNSKQPARDSTERVGRENVREIDMAEMQTLLKDIWGNLPQRERERMLQNPVEEFLPKYKSMIEKYFRRLAEQPDGNRE